MPLLAPVTTAILSASPRSISLSFLPVQIRSRRHGRPPRSIACGRSRVRSLPVAELKHPLFARFFDRLSRVMEKEVGDFRQELLSGLSGRVVEVGAGNGINFSHYPPAVDEVIAIEPEPYLRGKAAEAARGAQVTVSVRPGVADALELEDASVDAAVA